LPSLQELTTFFKTHTKEGLPGLLTHATHAFDHILEVADDDEGNYGFGDGCTSAGSQNRTATNRLVVHYFHVVLIIFSSPSSPVDDGPGAQGDAGETYEAVELTTNQRQGLQQVAAKNTMVGAVLIDGSFSGYPVMYRVFSFPFLTAPPFFLLQPRLRTTSAGTEMYSNQAAISQHR
jgi:hypothetical protein